MTTLDFPTGLPEPATFDWWLAYNTRQHESPLSRQVQTIETPGARWMAELRYPPLKKSQWRIMTSFLAQMRGAAGRVYWYPPYPARTPDGLAGGTPLVNGADQTGSTLITDGWTAAAVALRRGDYFSFVNPLGSDELKIVREDATADGSGNVTLTFDPPIRSAPYNNTAIRVTNPRAVFGLADDDQGRVSYEEASMAGVSFALIERF